MSGERAQVRDAAQRAMEERSTRNHRRRSAPHSMPSATWWAGSTRTRCWGNLQQVLYRQVARIVISRNDFWLPLLEPVIPRGVPPREGGGAERSRGNRGSYRKTSQANSRGPSTTFRTHLSTAELRSTTRGCKRLKSMKQCVKMRSIPYPNGIILTQGCEERATLGFNINRPPCLG